MKKTISGIFVTTIVVYLFGFFYWGVSTMPYSAWHQTADDAAAQQALAKHFPESGTYFIPGTNNPAEKRTELYDNGPVGFVQIKHGPSLETDPSIMVGGLVLNLIIVSLLAVMFKVSGASEFRDFARLSVVAGAVAVIGIHGGDIVWWRAPVDWKIWLLLYDYTVWLIAGHLLGIFMKRAPETAQ